MHPRLLAKDPFLARLMAWSQEKGIKPTVKAQASTTSGGSKKLKLSIYGPIGSFFEDSVTDKAVAEALEAEDPDEVELTLNSPGGDAFMGIAIFNLLKSHRAKVTVKVVGEAASAAGIISQAGDEIVMGTGSMLMIHNAWTIALGDWNEMKGTAKLLRKLDRSQADILSSRSQLTSAQALNLMEAETWFTAQEAVAKGLATSTTSADEDFEDLEEEEEETTTLRTSEEEPEEEDEQQAQKAKALAPSPIAGLRPIGSFFS